MAALRAATISSATRPSTTPSCSASWVSLAPTRTAGRAESRLHGRGARRLCEQLGEPWRRPRRTTVAIQEAVLGLAMGEHLAVRITQDVIAEPHRGALELEHAGLDPHLVVVAGRLEIVAARLENR